jgi:hypothetical protein
VTPDGQRPKWHGQNPRQNLRVDSVVHQDAPINDSADNGESHRRFPHSVQWLPMFNRNLPATLTGNLGVLYAPKLQPKISVSKQKGKKTAFKLKAQSG